MRRRIKLKHSKWLILLVLISVIGLVEAKDKILYQNGNAVFTQRNANELLTLAEFLGRSSFSEKDRKALQAWSILDFKAAPKVAVKYYIDLHNNMLPKIRSMKNLNQRNNFRMDVFLNYVNLFAKHPEYKKSPNNFVAVIERYNPPVQEILLRRQIEFNQLQQAMQTNQMMFNQTMRVQQQSADIVNNSIRDLGNQQSITLSGGTILYTTKDRIYAKDSKGRKFDIPK